MFMGLRSDPHKIKSKEGIDICWAEEADRISQDSLDFLIPTIRKAGSELWFSYNPDDPKAPVHDMFVSNIHPNAYVRKVNYDQNPWFPDELRLEMEYDKRRDPDKYQHIWLGETRKQSESLVFKNKWKIGTFEAPEDTVFYYGADWGFSKDPTTLVRLYVDSDTRKLYIDYEAYQVGVEIDDIPRLFDKVPGSRKWAIIADSARPETISYLRNRGFDIDSARKGKGSIEDGVEFLKSYDIIIHERCKHAIYEFGSYSYKKDKLTGEPLPVLEDKNNHIIDSARYALENVRKPKVFI
jgi:phage terminase large subunit